MSNRNQQPQRTFAPRHARHAATPYPQSRSDARTARAHPSRAFASAHGAQTVRRSPQMRENPRRSHARAWRVVFWVAIVVFVCAAAALAVIGFSYWQGQQKYAAVAEGALSGEVSSLPSDDAASPSGGSVLAAEFVNWDVLLAENPDTVGWVYVPGTSVNYPIVQASDNETYLHTDFSGEESWPVSYGAIFLDAACAGDFSSGNSIVYGHHMSDGSMFAPLADLADTAAFNEHRTVYVFTPSANYRLETFAVVVVAPTDPLAQPEFADEQERLDYLADKLARSVVEPDPTAAPAEEIGRIFTFVTCTDYSANDQRVVVFASVVEEAASEGAGA